MPDESSLADYNAGVNELIELNRAQFEATGNPLFAWHSLRLLDDMAQTADRMVQFIARASGEPKPTRNQPPAPLELPRWVAEFVLRTAMTILDWPDGKDLKLLAGGLGLSRKGWNAYGRAAALAERAHLAETHALLRETHSISANEATELMRKLWPGDSKINSGDRNFLRVRSFGKLLVLSNKVTKEKPKKTKPRG